MLSRQEVIDLIKTAKIPESGSQLLFDINPLSDDYIKFIRYGQHYIQKNGEGILAYISNNSFIDGVIHRRMREMLLDDFDLLYIIDLHGNSNKREVDSKGNRDQNVFDIQQGVSINILVKTLKSTSKTSVKHSEILGSRGEKYNFLNDNSIETIDWKTLKALAPDYFFVPKDFSLKKIYETYFSLNDLFPFSNSGIKTHRDDFIIDFNEEYLVTRINEFYSDSLTDKEIISKYSIKESKTFNVNDIRNSNSFKPSKINKILYRPFDERSIYYDSGLIDRAREDVVSHIIGKENLTLITVRQAVSSGEYMHFMVSESMSDNRVFYSNKGIPQIIPLYLYPEESTQQTLDGQPERTPNLDQKIVKEIAEKLGLKFVPEKEEVFAGPDPRSPGKGKGASSREIPDQVRDDEVFAPIDLLDYIYAVLHSPSYREKYKEFLKIDFPRVPYPEDPEQFWQLVKLGGELRQIHLLEHPVVEDFITTYPESGDNVISNRLTKNDPGFVPEDDDETMGKVWINETQYFGNVPKKAWEFYIGGYQPAEKWLKDRRDRELSIDEIRHYQKIIVALMETDRIMGEIDGVWG